MTDTFFPGDIRNQLKGWMKDNCLSPVYTYSKAEKCHPQTVEHLSLALVERKRESLRPDTFTQLRYEIMNCGKRGECQEHKETKEQRFVGFYCQNRSFHLPCAIKYRAGQGQEDLNQFMEIIKANDLWGFYKWEFTLPDEARKWIDKNPEKSKEFLKEVRVDAVAKTINKIFGVNTKARKLRPGFKVLYHPASSGNPFKQSSHFHALILPLLADLKNNTLKPFPKRIDHDLVKRIYKTELDKILKKYGLHDAVKDKYVVHLGYVEKELESSVIHAFKYNNRSMVQDILNKIKRVKVPEYSEYVCLLYDKSNEVWIPCIKTETEILDALEYVLNPVIQIRMAYGFLRQIKKYSKLLGVERDDYQDDDNWIKLYDIEIRRMHRTLYNKDTERLVRIVEVYIKRADSREAWRKLKPDEVRGERAAMGGRKLFRAIT